MSGLAHQPVQSGLVNLIVPERQHELRTEQSAPLMVSLVEVTFAKGD